MNDRTDRRMNVRFIEAELSWYFGPGQSAFERSTFGPMLERAALFAFDSNGAPIPTDPPMELVYAADGETPIALRVALTARMTHGAAHGEPGYEPDDRALQRYARVSRRLDRVSPRQFEVLELYFGNRGDRWGHAEIDPKTGKVTRQVEVGRIFSLYAMTRAGREILEGVDGCEQSTRSDDRLHVEWVLQKANPDAQRGKRFGRADDQARAMLHDAMDGYRNALPAKDEVLAGVIERLKTRRLDKLEQLFDQAIADKEVA